MLKKAGIIVTATTAALLALSPFAFATDEDNSVDHTSMGLVNISDNNANGTANGLCNNDVALGGLAAVQKGVPVQAVGGAAAPVTSTNVLASEDGRSCGIDSTSAGDSAGDN